PIVFKALEKDRNLRYESAADLRSDLARLKRDLDSGRSGSAATSARASSASTSAAAASSGSIPAAAVSSSSRKYVIATIAVVVLGVAGAAGAYLLRGRLEAKKVKSLAVLPFVYVSGDQKNGYLSDGMGDILVDALSLLGRFELRERGT